MRTTLDFNTQRLADQALRDGLIAYDRKHGWRGATEKLGGVDNWQARLKKHLVDRPFTGPPKIASNGSWSRNMPRTAFDSVTGSADVRTSSTPAPVTDGA